MQTILEKNGYLWIIFNYNPRLVEAVKMIPGRKWDPTARAWKVPLSSKHVVDTFAVRYGFSFKVNNTVAPTKSYIIPDLPELTVQIPLKLKLFPFQEKGVAYALKKKRLIIGDQMGLGKSQPLTVKIATPDGFKNMGDLTVGQKIFSRDGGIQFVEAIYPQGIRPVYKITFSDNSNTECDAEHLWAFRDINRIKRNTGWTVKTLKQIMSMGLKYKISKQQKQFNRSQSLKFQIPLTKPVKYSEKQYVIHPYIMGMLLGDGYLSGDQRHSICISIPNSEIESVKRIESFLPDYLHLKVNSHPACPQYYFNQTRTTKKNPYRKEIIRLGLNVKGHEKFIPEIYLQGSVSQRIDLLRGLMDSDGSSVSNKITFHSCCKILANGVVELVQSLGGKATLFTYDRTKHDKGIEYRVNVRLDICPFYLERKVNQWSVPVKNYISRFIKAIEYIGEKECQCIKVSSPDNLYLTDNYIVTHNTAQAIATITAADAFPCLIICPASLKLNWQREWHMWTDKKAMLLADKNKDTWPQFAKINGNIFGGSIMNHVFIVNYESLKKYFVASIDKPEGAPLRLNHIKFKQNITIFKSVIIDESHRTKELKTLQTKLTKGITHGKEWILALTGTPVVNKPKDLISQLGIIDQLETLGGYKNFNQRYCDDENNHEALKELNYNLSVNCFYRRDKSEVLKDLPAKVRQVVLCDITTKKEYRDALSDLEIYLKKYKHATDEQVARSMRGEVMVRIGVLKNISARGKITDVVEYVNDVIESGEKLVLFTHLHDVQKNLMSHFPDALTIFGDDDGNTRQKNIDQFQKSDKQLIICSIKAAGVGITLTAASRVAFVELPWHPADSEQCEDRCHRIGQTDSVQCTYFLGKDTIDEWIYQIIDSKRSIANAITGSRDQIEETVMDGIINLFTMKL